MDVTSFEAGQLWCYRTRAHEAESRVLIQRVESDARLGEIVHIRVINLEFKGPKGTIAVLPHLPYGSDALRKSVTMLESLGEQVPSDYLQGYAIWREAFDAGKAGVFTLDIAGVLDAMEQATSK